MTRGSGEVWMRVVPQHWRRCVRGALASLWLVAALAPLRAVAGQAVPVLVLHSYHPGFTWTDKEQRGIQGGFRAAGVEVELQVEYLDAKRHPGPAVRAAMEALLRAKPGASLFPVVIVTDNAALEFALDVRPRLFPDAAVVYCGLNGPPEAVVAGRPGVTGVLELWDPAATLRAIARLQPGVRSILVVHDQTESGLGTRADLDQVRSAFEPRFHFEFLPAEPLAATLARVEALPPDWAVLLLGYNVDSAGQALDSRETGPLLARHARVGVYTLDETRFGGGVVGGGLLTGEQQGEVAARLAARIIAGVPADAIPPVRHPVSKLVFDDRALRRLGIAAAALPPGSRVLNAPTTYYQRHPVRVWGLGAFVVALVVLAVVLAVNLALRRRAEAALRDGEASLRITLDSIGDAVIAADARAAVTRMNPAAEVLAGVTLEQARGRPVAEVLRLQDAGGQPVDSPVVRALAEGRPVALPRATFLLARDGTRREVADSAGPIRDAAGAVVGAVLVLRDVTAERALQERLRQAQRMEVIGQLAGGVAHDFNNILTAILGSAQLLAERLPPGSDERDLADELLTAAGRASELTHQLLAYSRKGPLQMTPVHVHAVVDEVIHLLSRSIDKRIEIRRELAAEPEIVLGDPAQLQSALLNLALNGRDAMPEGGVLTFASGVVDGAGPDGAPAGEHLAVRVRDTGVGMTEEVRAHLFEPYFTTKPPGKGTGLGLASVWGCVQSHRGQVRVESAPGQGTTVTLLLPLLRPAASAPPPAAPARPPRGRGRILVIDDEEIVRNTVARMLRSLGHAVDVVADGDSADGLVRARPGAFDLVVLDLVMPRQGGREVFHRLRRLDPGLRVLIASGFTQHEVTDELLRDGASGFLRKPIRLEDLARQVDAALATRPEGPRAGAGDGARGRA